MPADEAAATASSTSSVLPSPEQGVGRQLDQVDEAAAAPELDGRTGQGTGLRGR